MSAENVAWVVFAVAFIGIGVSMAAGFPSKTHQFSAPQMGLLLCWCIALVALVMAVGAGHKP